MATISGGDKLTAALNELAKGLDKGATLEVGFLPGATYPDGTLVAMVAAIQEFGAPSRGIPPRPFFRNMIAQNSPQWPKAVGDLLKSTGYDAQKTLEMTGEGIKGELQQSIVSTNSPPNAPSTIAQKGSSKPLVDTGHMLNSIDFIVK